MKCAICGKEIEHTFLNKIKGNYIKYKGKTIIVCSSCMKKFRTKEKVIEYLEHRKN